MKKAEYNKMQKRLALLIDREQALKSVIESSDLKFIMQLGCWSRRGNTYLTLPAVDGTRSTHFMKSRQSSRQSKNMERK